MLKLLSLLVKSSDILQSVGESYKQGMGSGDASASSCRQFRRKARRYRTLPVIWSPDAGEDVAGGDGFRWGASLLGLGLGTFDGALETAVD